MNVQVWIYRKLSLLNLELCINCLIVRLSPSRHLLWGSRVSFLRLSLSFYSTSLTWKFCSFRILVLAWWGEAVWWCWGSFGGSPWSSQFLVLSFFVSRKHKFQSCILRYCWNLALKSELALCSEATFRSLSRFLWYEWELYQGRQF